MAKLPQGIYKQKNSEFYWVRKTINGRKYRTSTETTSIMRARAFYEDWVAELKQKIKNGEPVETAKKKEPEPEITFRELVERYTGFIKGRLKSAGDVEYMARKMVDIFGNKNLSDFTLSDIEKLQNDKLKQGLSIRTANHYPILLKTMFRKAVDWELVDESIVKKLAKCKNLKGENKRLRYLSDEEAESLINACEPTYLKPVVITALNTGMRRNEILKLTWNRVDLKNRLILLDKTKNGERREIPINYMLYNTLSGIIRHIGTDYVFYNPKDKELKPFERLDRSWHTALKKAKILDFHFHDLRHTFASWLVMSGVPLLTVSKLLGHKDIKMTLRYAHLSPDVFKEAMGVLDKKAYFGHSEENLENIETRKA